MEDDVKRRKKERWMARNEERMPHILLHLNIEPGTLDSQLFNHKGNET